MGETTEMLLRMPEVCRLTGRTRDQVYRDIRAGLFPAPLKRGTQSIWVVVHYSQREYSSPIDNETGERNEQAELQQN